MPEDLKTPPQKEETGQPKSAEELMTELKKTNEKLSTLEKQVKDKEEFIGKQSTEIGELRKHISGKDTSKDSDKDADPEVKEVAEEFMKKGLDEETAKYNAEILISFDRKRASKRVMNETTDLILEAIDEGKVDKKVFDETKDDVIAEYNNRKLTLSPRQNYKIFRDCMDIVVKRKADEIRKQNEKKDESKREGLIDEQGQAPGGGAKPPEPDQDKTARDSIRNAGRPRDNAFF